MVKLIRIGTSVFLTTIAFGVVTVLVGVWRVSVITLPCEKNKQKYVSSNGRNLTLTHFPRAEFIPAYAYRVHHFHAFHVP